MSRVIQKQRPTRKAPRGKRQPLQTGIKIRVSELRIGDRIVTRWHAKKLEEVTPEEAVQMLDQFYSNGEQSDWVAKSDEVKQIEECPGKWRTHIHVNHRDCYDTRQYVWIVKA